MSKNYTALKTEKQKDIRDKFTYLAYRHEPWEVWTDFITLSACSLCLSDHESHEAEYVRIAKKYTTDELNQFVGMFASTIAALELNPDQDFLGDLYMRLNLGKAQKGQFFTPYNLCKAMARITAGNLKEQVEEKKWISVNDPTVGAGALLIAFAQECIRQEVNFQNHVLFVGQDIDRTAALMCFLQLSLLGCPGYVVIGDALLHPVVGQSVLLPIPQKGQEIWYTPTMFTDIWQWRLALEKINYLTKKSEYEIGK